jgi:hypothetical protein
VTFSEAELFLLLLVLHRSNVPTLNKFTNQMCSPHSSFPSVSERGQQNIRSASQKTILLPITRDPTSFIYDSDKLTCGINCLISFFFQKKKQKAFVLLRRKLVLPHNSANPIDSLESKAQAVYGLYYGASCKAEQRFLLLLEKQE